MSKLENYIKLNRENFDSEEVPDHLWSKIKADLPIEKKQAKYIRLNVKKLYQMAATLAVIIVAGFVFYQMPSLAHDTDGVSNLDLQEIDRYYNQHFNKAKASFASNASYDVVAADQATIDEVIAELKIELKNIPEDRQEQIVSLIIENYKLKIKLLERILSKQQNKNYNNELFEI